MGKTALAVYWAHQVAAEFPDGHLYIDLRGYDPGQPVSAANALARFLGALGVGGRDIPAGLDERTAMYRSLLSGRRMAVLLDNAASDEQVRPLLPAASGCVTVITSRDSLAGLIARDGAVRLSLDVLPMTEAVELLLALIGHRAEADLAAAKILASQCCRLPLALRVACGTGHGALAGVVTQAHRRACRPATSARSAGRGRRRSDGAPRGIVLVLPELRPSYRPRVPVGWPASRP